MTPTVSVCVPTFNGAATIGAALRSVIAQRFRDFEVLVIDDGSSDETLDIVRSMSADLPALRIEMNESNLGLAGNWNRCLDLARGTWVKYLFQDDLLHPDCLGRMIGAGGGVDLVVCHRRARYADATDRRRREYAAYLRWSSLRRFVGRDQRLSVDDAAALIASHPFVNVLGEPVAHLIRRDAAKTVRFDARLIQLVDYDMAARLALRRGVSYVDRALATFTVHEGSTTVANYERRRFTLDVVDPARLAVRYVEDSDYAPLRSWAADHRLDLEEIVEDRLAVADQWLQRATETERAEWNDVLLTESGLARRWQPPYQPPDPPSVPTIGRRVRSWCGLAARRVVRLVGRATRARGRV